MAKRPHGKGMKSPSQTSFTQPELVTKARALGFDECAFFDRPPERGTATPCSAIPPESIRLVADSRLTITAPSVAFQLERKEYLKDVKRSLKQAAKRCIASRRVVVHSGQTISLLHTLAKTRVQQIVDLSENIQIILDTIAQVGYVDIMPQLVSVSRVQIV